jgi:hypothetical protein
VLNVSLHIVAPSSPIPRKSLFRKHRSLRVLNKVTRSTNKIPKSRLIVIGDSSPGVAAAQALRSQRKATVPISIQYLVAVPVYSTKHYPEKEIDCQMQCENGMLRYIATGAHENCAIGSLRNGRNSLDSLQNCGLAGMCVPRPLNGPKQQGSSTGQRRATL